jgi:hypothetical protein
MKVVQGGGGTLRVEIKSLLAASAHLETMRATVEEIASRHGLVESIDVGSAGSVVAADAIASFLHHWSFGLSCLSSDISSLAKALRQAAGAYQRVDAEIVRGAGG